MTKTFFKYVIPSMLAFALSGIYAIVDGFFVGNSVGDQGLATINLVYPLVALIQAAGTGVGMAGAIHFAIAEGGKRINERNRYFWITCGLLIAVSLLLTLVYLPLNKTLLHLLGRQGQLEIYGLQYMRVITVGILFQVLGVGLVPLIRNMGKSLQAMAAMIAGFLTNIVLDYLLVWILPYGLPGAAAATVLGQAVTVLWCAAVLFPVRKALKAQWDKGWEYQTTRILKLTPSPLGLTFVPNVTLILINWSAMQFGGDPAVSAYAVISYVCCVMLLLLQGVSDGTQPLFSQYYGEQKPDKVRRVRRLAFQFGLAIALASVLLLYGLRYEAAVLFGASEEIVAMVGESLPIFILGFVFVAISRIAISYFYATEKNKYAYLLIYGEPLILAALLLILPQRCGIAGTWAAVPASQLAVAVLSLGLLKKAQRKEEKIRIEQCREQTVERSC